MTRTSDRRRHCSSADRLPFWVPVCVMCSSRDGVKRDGKDLCNRRRRLWRLLIPNLITSARGPTAVARAQKLVSSLRDGPQKIQKSHRRVACGPQSPAESEAAPRRLPAASQSDAETPTSIVRRPSSLVCRLPRRIYEPRLEQHCRRVLTATLLTTLNTSDELLSSCRSRSRSRSRPPATGPHHRPRRAGWLVLLPPRKGRLSSHLRRSIQLRLRRADRPHNRLGQVRQVSQLEATQGPPTGQSGSPRARKGQSVRLCPLHVQGRHGGSQDQLDHPALAETSRGGEGGRTDYHHVPGESCWAVEGGAGKRRSQKYPAHLASPACLT